MILASDARKTFEGMGFRICLQLLTTNKHVFPPFLWEGFHCIGTQVEILVLHDSAQEALLSDSVELYIHQNLGCF